ncbi:hypothetical protein BJ741DRAFT_597558 [Chytriomyces cf. hyalinus JEL632]|nr:hypothetical protein BJ741DRAFT_597558 [Chytriomyces cf. hyalinus JEL632]
MAFANLLWAHHNDLVATLGNCKLSLAADANAEIPILIEGDAIMQPECQISVPDEVTLDVPNLPQLGNCVDRPPLQVPATLNKCLETESSKRLLYLSMRSLLLACNDSLEAMAKGTKQIIPEAVEWFFETWNDRSLRGPEDLSFRISIFVAFKKMHSIISNSVPAPANREALKAALRKAIQLEPLSDVVFSLFIDTDTCIPDAELLEWGARLCLAETSDSFQDAKESAILHFSKKFELAKFAYPNPLNEERLTQSIKHGVDRVDLTHILLSRVVTLGHLHHAISCAPELYQGQDCITVYMQIEWILQFLNKHSAALSIVTARIASEVCATVSAQIDPTRENETWQFVCADFSKKMAFVLEKNSLTEYNAANPPIAMNYALQPSKISLLLSKKMSETKDFTSKIEASSNNMFASVLSVKCGDPSSFVDPMNVISGLDDVRFQVDPSSERIILKSDAGSMERASEEVLTSTSSGSLIITRRELLWSPATLDFSNPTGFTYNRNNAFRIRHSAILRFSVNKYKPLSGSAGVTIVAPPPGESPSAAMSDEAIPNYPSQQNGGGAENVGEKPVLSSSGRRMNSLAAMSADMSKLLSAVYNRNNGSNGVKDVQHMHAVVIHTRNGAFKFYPFFDGEVMQIMHALTAVTGMLPFKGSEFVQSVLTKRVEVTRRQALRQLLQEESPWIENSMDLQQIIAALISEVKPQLIVDMERLFHSCKIEGEVTKEATAMLRKAWHQTTSEQSRLKILSVVDRILDRAIMRQDDAVFATTYKWLKHLEETINAYRNPEILKLVLYLLKRAKMIQVEPLSSLPHDQCITMFDYYEDYTTLISFSEEFGVKLHVVT